MILDNMRDKAETEYRKALSDVKKHEETTENIKRLDLLLQVELMRNEESLKKQNEHYDIQIEMKYKVLEDVKLRCEKEFRNKQESNIEAMMELKENKMRVNDLEKQEEVLKKEIQRSQNSTILESKKSTKKIIPISMPGVDVHILERTIQFLYKGSISVTGSKEYEDFQQMMEFLEIKIHTPGSCQHLSSSPPPTPPVSPNSYVMGEYQWMTFEEVNKSSINFGRGLRELGHKLRENIAIFAETRAEWMIAAHGCFKQNFPLVTLYATLGEDAIAHAINETEVSIVITTHELFPKIKNILHKTPRVKTVIYMEDQLHSTDIKNCQSGVEIIPFQQVLSNGENSKLDRVAPTTEDIAIIMYTSGSMGVPKGVLITHTNMMATMGAFSDAVTTYDDDVFLGFLPLAHVFELLTESVCLLCGIPIGYSTPLTMIDTSSKIKRGTKGDASATCMTAVPLILDRIYKGVLEKLSKAGPLKKAAFDFSFNYKRDWMKRGFSTPLIDRLIFKQTRQLLGGRVRLILCGGAPLSPDTHELIKVCLCEGVIHGYGLTETTSCATVMSLNDRSRGRAGGPTTVCEMRLVDWEEGKYKVTDKPFPRGEIIIGGDNISPGYYKNSEKTKEDFFEEDGKRWFRTGDIGEIHEDGVLKIIDRKKDLVKLQAGEYVSLGKVESELKTCPLVENICVYGDSNKDHVVALMVPNPVHLSTLAQSIGKSADLTFEQLCSDKQVETAVIAQLAAHGKKCKLERFEIPTAVKLCTEVWSPDMGLVTAAFKLKRKDIQERYQHEINRMYASSLHA